jgi:hypothetical protein
MGERLLLGGRGRASNRNCNLVGGFLYYRVGAECRKDHLGWGPGSALKQKFGFFQTLGLKNVYLAFRV